MARAWTADIPCLRLRGAGPLLEGLQGSGERSSGWIACLNRRGCYDRREMAKAPTTQKVAGICMQKC